MYINNYQNMLKEIRNKILNNEFKYKNTILVGDNASGKSEILKGISSECREGYYFIDSINRTFDYQKVSSFDNLKYTYRSVLRTRVLENNFNLKDTFDIDKTGMGVIEKVYFNYKDQLNKMLKEFLGKDIKIEVINNDILGSKKYLHIDGEVEKLSSGYQAIMRIFLELLYFNDSLEDNIENSVVVIDEINEFLSSRNEERILPFLMSNFPNMNFIITTHSPEVVASSIDCNIIAIKDCSYQWLDGNDFSSVTDAREIFSKISDLNEEEKADDIEILLRNLLNCKISGIWTDKEEEKLNSIDENVLTNAQKLLLMQIRSW